MIGCVCNDWCEPNNGTTEETFYSCVCISCLLLEAILHVWVADMYEYLLSCLDLDAFKYLIFSG